MRRVHMGAGESTPHAGAAAPDSPGIPPYANPHAVGPAPAGSPSDSSCASRHPPTAASAGDTTPSCADPASTEPIVSAHSSPADSGADPDEDFARSAGSPVAPRLPIAVDNQ
jgi:hypothetical protein